MIMENRYKNRTKHIYEIILLIFPILLLVGMFFIGDEKIVIDYIKPDQVHMETTKVAAVYGKGFKAGDIIYINDRPQVTTFGNEGWITCDIEEEVYDEKDTIKVEVKRPNTILNKKSNEKILNVEK